MKRAYLIVELEGELDLIFAMVPAVQLDMVNAALVPHFKNYLPGVKKIINIKIEHAD